MTKIPVFWTLDKGLIFGHIEKFRGRVVEGKKTKKAWPLIIPGIFRSRSPSPPPAL